MENFNLNISEVSIKKGMYDILSADTDFYAFMGERAYYAFDRLICDEDIELFNKKVRDNDRELFAIRLKDEAGKCMYYLMRTYYKSEDKNVTIKLAQAERFVQAGHKCKKGLAIRERLLELYNDDFFDYDVRTGRVVIYSTGQYTNERKEFTLEEFEEYICNNSDESSVKSVNRFFAALRNGERYAELIASRNFVNDTSGIKSVNIRACAIYNNCVYERMVGYIHAGTEKVQSVRKKVNLDLLTGLISKADITNAAIEYIDRQKLKGTSIAIVDVDYFKRVNDTFGHKRGDDVLRKVADIIKEEVGSNGLVGRIGGDEFFIIFFKAYDLENARGRLRSIKNRVISTFPAGVENQPAITLSIGCAAYPKDAVCYEDLFTLADFALYRAKAKGRNRYIIFDSEKHGTLEEIRNMKMNVNRINSRGDMSVGDILCDIMDKVYAGGYPLEQLLDDIVVNFGIQRIMIYSADENGAHHVACMAGEKRPSDDIIAQTEQYVDDEEFGKRYEDGMMVIDNISILDNHDSKAYNMLKKQEVLSFIHVKTQDKNGKDVILSIESVSKRVTWNKSWLHYYRIMGRLIKEYSI